MRNLKMTVAYEGSDFAGWQVQPGQRTVQGEIEAVLAELEGDYVKVHGSGRTDAGVHALGQVCSFELQNPLPLENLPRALNHRLPPAIRVLAVEQADRRFHARHSATAKTYEYRIVRDEVCSPFERRTVFHLPYPLDEEAMAAAAPKFEGERDFRSLASVDPKRADQSTVRFVHSSILTREAGRLFYRVRGSGFLYNMVRNIVGTLIEVGRGNFEPEDIDRILDARDRRAAGPTAPAAGLFLVSVEYDETPSPDQLCSREC